MEMTDRLSTLAQESQIKVMVRVFQKFSLAFGNQMNAKWQGIDMQAVYADWAEELGDMSLGSIDHGVKAAKNCLHPPSQGEFKDLCRSYRPQVPMMIGKQITPEQQEKNRQKIAELSAMLSRNKAMQ